MYQYIQMCLTSFAISLFLIPLILLVSKKFSLYDRIDERKVHKGNISRLGGLAIFLGFFVAFMIWQVPHNNFKFNIYLYTSAMFLAFITGFVDDIFHVRARIKLVLQIVSGILVSLSGLLINNFQVYSLFKIDFGFFAPILTVIWVVAFMNAINLLDGMDGLASGIVFIANIFIFILALTMNNMVVASISVIMAGAILGFYVFNFPPAKIFMGDGGAYFLGFMYSTIPLMGIKKSAVATLFLFPLILLLVPLTDIALVIFKRLKLGYNIFIADKNHLHHRLMSVGLTIRGILLIMYSYTIILGLLSILLLHIQPKYSVLLFILIALILLISLYLLNQAEKIIEANQECKDEKEE